MLQRTCKRDAGNYTSTATTMNSCVYVLRSRGLLEMSGGATALVSVGSVIVHSLVALLLGPSHDDERRVVVGPGRCRMAFRAAQGGYMEETSPEPALLRGESCNSVTEEYSRFFLLHYIRVTEQRGDPAAGA